MGSNTLIKYCPNYYKITEFEFFEDDYISYRLVTFYKDYVCNIEKFDVEDLKRATAIDKVISKYIDDYTFRNEMKRELVHIKVKSTVSNILKVIIDNIIKIFEKYEIDSTRKIYISRWI